MDSPPRVTVTVEEVLRNLERDPYSFEKRPIISSFLPRVCHHGEFEPKIKVAINDRLSKIQ